MFRYGSTGVQEAIKKAVHTKGYFPAYPVKNIHKFTCDRTTHVFRDCILLPPGTTMREFAHIIDQNLEKYFAHAEGVAGQRVCRLLPTYNISLLSFAKHFNIKIITPNLEICLLYVDFFNFYGFVQQLGEDEEVTLENNIIKFTMLQPQEQAATAAATSSASDKKKPAPGKKPGKEKEKDKETGSTST